MVAEEEARIRRFVRGQLRDERDLSSLTLGVLKRRYLLHMRCESLSPEAKSIMKRVVLEELMKMQDIDRNGSELEAKKLQNKRKREEENDEVTSGGEEESTAKKSRCQSASSSESEDKGSEESEEEEQIKSGPEDDKQEVKKSQRKKNGKQPINSEDSADEDINESEKEENESNCGDGPKEMVKNKASTTKKGETGSSDASQGKKTLQSDEENDTDKDSESEKSDKINASDSSDDSEKEENASGDKKNSDPDSDSSSLPSLEDEQDTGTKNTQDDKKKKTVKKQESGKGQKPVRQDAQKAVVRLKRYIALCGVKQNYKKLLDGCRSVRSQVAVLKKKLEDLGVHGNPSINKCKKVRMKREQDEELAALDVNNIIATQGRPKRRASAWQEQHDPPSSTYLRTLNSGSESDREDATQRGRRRATDWTNLQGIISDDADSD